MIKILIAINQEPFVAPLVDYLAKVQWERNEVEVLILSVVEPALWVLTCLFLPRHTSNN